MQKLLPFFALLFGGMMIGFAGIFMRLADTGPIASAFWRMALALPLLWPLAFWFSKRARQFSPGFVWSGFLFAADMAIWHLALHHTTVANATLGSNLAPIVLALWAWIRWGQRFSAEFLAGLSAAILGAVFLVGPHIGGDGDRLYGDFLALLTAFFYAAYQAAIKDLRDRHDTFHLMAWGTTFSALFLLPAALLDARPLFPQSAEGWLVVSALALTAQVCGQVVIAYALAHLSVTVASVSLLIQPLTAAIAAWLLFDERLTGWQLFGGGLLLVGIVLAKRGERPVLTLKRPPAMKNPEPSGGKNALNAK